MNCNTDIFKNKKIGLNKLGLPSSDDTTKTFLGTSLLDKINSPKDMKDIDDLESLCEEIRNKIIKTVSKTGGHLASNLGVVELTVALYSIFNSDDDAIVWDVGHQSYTHKILTGRNKLMGGLRQKNGISGFVNSKESLYDFFTSGHSSTSISSALGLSYAKRISKKKGHVVAVIGDGALTGGLAYEGLNNAGHFGKNFIVVLNDNKMSISKNVGAIAGYLARFRTVSCYVRAKHIVEHILDKTPLIGHKLKNWLVNIKTLIKNCFYNSTIFEDMGFAYYGPVDGHNIHQLRSVFNVAANIDGPVFVHVITKKGKGYKFAEKNPKNFHGIPGFEIVTGNTCKSTMSFSDVFGKEIYNIAVQNPKVCAITAAMTSGTGLTEFSMHCKDRFFDVGIAEEHAVTFAGGLSKGGMIPVFAVYSSFLQRSYDQIIHDASLQNLGIILAIDRAGFVGEDGESHQGIFDVPFLNTIPHVRIFAPAFFSDLKIMLNIAVNNHKNITAIRYPRGTEFLCPPNYHCTDNDFDVYSEVPAADVLIITYGRIFSNAYVAAQNLKKYGIYADIMKLNVIKPIDINSIFFAKNFKKIFFFEESSKSGGIAEKFAYLLSVHLFAGEFFITAVEDDFVQHMTVAQQLEKYSLDAGSMAKKTLLKCGIVTDKFH
jgi:1-deoxy-D-xylulose-5-phosphate synthase